MTDKQIRKDFHNIEPEKDIILFCDNWSGDYKVEGRLIKYKKLPHKKSKPSRFCRLVDGKWESDSSNWSQRNGWQYK